MSNKFDIHIYGVLSRQTNILSTLNKLSLSKESIHYDDRENGGQPIYTARKAWLAPISPDLTHRIALQDDIEVCDNFIDVATQIMNCHPKDIISFFPFDFMRRNSLIENLPTPYIIADTLSACGIMMPVEYIQPCFDYIQEKYGDNCADDSAIHRWAEKEGIRILTTIPALIQHIGDKSLCNANSKIRRTIYYSLNPQANWESKEIAIYQPEEWFFSNHGVMREEDTGKVYIVSDNT